MPFAEITPWITAASNFFNASTDEKRSVEDRLLLAQQSHAAASIAIAQALENKSLEVAPKSKR
ncbi:hypothetical protein AX769_06710 [Frondihabitans sp. PAMC 28766]|uniref:hypothetical protein n=1 Tax=Frondihabitans sp. PAMC 28766 TaxID=1795630 RepID=UPI00078C653A|nr:hypothetical protein [Frondihabitans sp. PAMC 28766]AMM19904.1 hypothetical protein AX769_06710 [Frondihabitans sp. PAMC 28766]